MTARAQRPYLRRPEEFSYWKKSRATLGAGTEVYNYASPFARELWYYLRSMGHVKHPPGWKCEHHGEDGFLLHVVHRGELWHEVRSGTHASRSFRVKSGEACLLDLCHDVRYGVEGARTAELYWVWMNGRDMPRVFLELGADQNPVFALRDQRRLESLLRELQAITTREPTAFEVRSSGLLTLILAELFACRADRMILLSSGDPARPLSESVRKAIDYITRKYDEHLSVKHIATKVVERSLHYFSRRFHQEVGMSPIAYLNRYRIEQAKKFLVGSNHSIAQIARSVGFQNPRYFARMFVRIVGVTPVAYRKNPEKHRQLK
jgi:two-component system response regulator YesN